MLLLRNLLLVAGIAASSVCNAQQAAAQTEVRVTGVLIDKQTLAPIADEQILLFETLTQRQSAGQTSRTDDDGQFALTLPPGTYVLRARGSVIRNADDSGPVTVTLTGDSDVVDLGTIPFDAVPGAEITGTLLSEEKRAAVSGTQLMLVRAETLPDGRTSFILGFDFVCETDLNGQFRIKNVPRGQWTLVMGLSRLRTADGQGSVLIEITDAEGSIDLGNVLVRSR